MRVSEFVFTLRGSRIFPPDAGSSVSWLRAAGERAAPKACSEGLLSQCFSVIHLSWSPSW